MENRDNPAFPTAFAPGVKIYEGMTGLTKREYFAAMGLTKREYFAAMAMQGLVKDIVWQDSVTGEIHSHDFVAKCAIVIADELLKQLEQTKP